jgi:hypothetical protein
MRRLFTFPNPVNEVSARLVAGGVVVLCLLTLVTRQPLLLLPLCYGFWARVLTGPTLSPLGQLATRVVTPRLGIHRPTPGPPKRFAQGMGAAMSTAAVVSAFGFGSTGAAWVFVAMILVAASLESFLGFCLGCTVFGLLMRAGVIPASVCEECNDITARLAARRRDQGATA